jgi:uncharacterized surface protein with fasciclin (FAS1) repeats
MFRSLRSAVAVAAVALVGAACAADAPTAATSSRVADATADARRGTPSIVDIALGNPDFSTLVAAVVAADLVDALSGNRQLTVFAPTNAAFAELGLDDTNIGTALTKEQLQSILLYHVTPGRRVSPSVVRAPRIKMLSGGFTTISRTADGVQINSANIIGVDNKARNGIVHVIDAVLLP